MKLIIGLGNPGKEYEKTRHNAGFLAIDTVRSKLDGTAWKLEKKVKAELSTVTRDGEKIIMMKPQTFMNNSGQAVGTAARFYKIQPGHVWVIHDELDLPLGTLRIKIDGSSAGHNGVQSIIDTVGSGFVRFRIGIGTGQKEPAEHFVLKPFSKRETIKLKPVLMRVTDAIVTGLENGITVAMNQSNKK